MEQITEQRIAANGIELNVATAGPASGPLVLLLHGFPEFWYGWRRQIPHLAAAGLRVWAPDQRGYGASDKPAPLEAYGIDTLAADVVGLIDAAGAQQAFLVGHDWGAAIAWWVALRYPERLERLAILNGPHPAVMRAMLRRSPAQWLRSSYMLFFQLPRLPEALARAGNWRALAETMRRTSRPGTFGAAELARYRAAWSQPGAIGAMLNWYRAMARRPPRRPPDWRVRVPTLIVWGAEDAFLRASMARESLGWCERGRLELLAASHWVQHEEPARVNVLLESWLAEGPPPAGPMPPAAAPGGP